MPPLPNQPIGACLSYGFAPNAIPAHIPNPSQESSIDQFIDNNAIGWAIQGDNLNSSNFETDSIRTQDEFPCQAILVPDEDMPIYPFDFQTVSDQ